MRRRILPAAVVLALAGTIAAASLAPAPVELPAVALGAVLVWRAEVAALLFVAAYAALVTARLALHGHTFTRVGSAGVEIPQIDSQEIANAAEQKMELRRTVDALLAEIVTLGDRVTALEHPPQLLLNPDQEGA